jgi:hypothetical protein
MVPWFDRPIIYDVRARPSLISSTSGSRDLQMVCVCVCVCGQGRASCMERQHSGAASPCFCSCVGCSCCCICMPGPYVSSVPHAARCPQHLLNGHSTLPDLLLNPSQPPPCALAAR